MAKDKPKYKIVGINASEEERDAVKEVASEKGYKIASDYIRHLIEADAGKKIFNVDRGGDRRRERAG
jgi:hypothetical protein